MTLKKFELVNNHEMEMYKQLNTELAQNTEYHEVSVVEYGKFRVSEEPRSGARKT